MPIEDNKILKHNHREKSLKPPFMIYADVYDLCYHYTRKVRGAAHIICNLRYETPQKVPVVFHNGSTNDYHFMINQLIKEFDGQLKCFGENTDKCKKKIFSTSLKKT